MRAAGTATVMRRPRLPVVSTVTCIKKPRFEKLIKNAWLQNPRHVRHHTGSVRAGQEFRVVAGVGGPLLIPRQLLPALLYLLHPCSRLPPSQERESRRESIFDLVRMGRLELPRVTPLEPKSRS